MDLESCSSRELLTSGSIVEWIHTERHIVIDLELYIINFL